MNLHKKEMNTLFLMNLVQVFVSSAAFVMISYILLNILTTKVSILYLVLDMIVIGFIIDGIMSFIKDYKELQ